MGVVGFRRIRKEIEEADCGDDPRGLLECREGKVYFLQSDRHADELFVVVADATPLLLGTIRAVRSETDPDAEGDTVMEYGGICRVVYKAMLRCGGIEIGRGPEK